MCRNNCWLRVERTAEGFKTSASYPSSDAYKTPATSAGGKAVENEKRRAGNEVDIPRWSWHTRWAVDMPFCWTGGPCSLTTDTMCQNLFEAIRVFERGWSE